MKKCTGSSPAMTCKKTGARSCNRPKSPSVIFRGSATQMQRLRKGFCHWRAISHLQQKQWRASGGQVKHFLLSTCMNSCVANLNVGLRGQICCDNVRFSDHNYLLNEASSLSWLKCGHRRVIIALTTGYSRRRSPWHLTRWLKESTLCFRNFPTV